MAIMNSFGDESRSCESITLGDLNVYGRVFLSTAGRGIIVGEPAP